MLNEMMIREPTIYDLLMHDSCINYPNMLTVSRVNCAFGKLCFAYQVI